MLPDWDTNTVHISELLLRRHPDIAVAFSRILAENALSCKIIHQTKDIWCRDFMPIQVNDSKYVQFQYEPDYLISYDYLRTPPLTDHPQTQLNLDGGNVVGCKTAVIVTDKVYKENPSLSRTVIRDKLESIFDAQVIVIPKPPFDYIGHSDGVVRFINERTVLVNECSNEEKPYGDKIVALLQKNGLQVELFPYYYLPPPKNKCEIDTAVGVYMNFLRVGNVIILPSFDLPMDDTARKVAIKFFPTAKIYQVPAIRLAEAGGVFNCITWTTREGTEYARPEYHDAEPVEDTQLPHELSLYHACR